MGWSGLDQRHFPRIAVRCDIWICEKNGAVIKTRTENLGGGGVCVILFQELEKFSNVHLKVTLKDQTPPFECEGRVVWTVRSKDPATHQVSYDTGIEFVHLQAPDEAAILEMTEAHLERPLS